MHAHIHVLHSDSKGADYQSSNAAAGNFNFSVDFDQRWVPICLKASYIKRQHICCYYYYMLYVFLKTQLLPGCIEIRLLSVCCRIRLHVIQTDLFVICYLLKK